MGLGLGCDAMRCDAMRCDVTKADRDVERYLTCFFSPASHHRSDGGRYRDCRDDFRRVALHARDRQREQQRDNKMQYTGSIRPR